MYYKNLYGVELSGFCLLESTFESACDDESQSGPAEVSQSIPHGVGELAKKLNNVLK